MTTNLSTPTRKSKSVADVLLKVTRYFLFVDELPMNAAGKILKYKMRDESAEKLGLKNKNKFSKKDLTFALYGAKIRDKFEYHKKRL